MSTNAGTTGRVSADPDHFSYDPFAPEVMEDPLPFYRTMREHFPVYYIEKYDTFFLSRFEDAYEMLSKTDNTFIASEGARPTPEVFLQPNRGHAPVASTNPLAPHAYHGSPVHEILRQAHSRPLRPGAVQKLTEFVRTIARERLDLLVPRGRFDLVQQYAGIVAASVQCHLFRLPMSEAKYVLDTMNAGSITDPTTGSYDPKARFDRLCEIIEPGIRRRRREGADGSWPIMDGMLDVEIDGRKLSDREIAETVGIVMLGGSETVPKVVGHGLWELAKQPQQMAAVRADIDSNSAAAFKEMVRYCGPAQWFTRTVHKPTEVGGVAVGVGQRVVYLIPSAARDEREYGPDSEKFRWNRPIDRWVNFGHGPMFCLGYHLALMEGRVLLQEFLKRVQEFTVDEPRVVRFPSSFQWSYNELPIFVPIAD